MLGKFLRPEWFPELFERPRCPPSSCNQTEECYAIRERKDVIRQGNDTIRQVLKDAVREEMFTW